MQPDSSLLVRDHSTRLAPVNSARHTLRLCTSVVCACSRLIKDPKSPMRPGASLGRYMPFCIGFIMAYYTVKDLWGCGLSPII